MSFGGSRDRRRSDQRRLRKRPEEDVSGTGVWGYIEPLVSGFAAIDAIPGLGPVGSDIETALNKGGRPGKMAGFALDTVLSPAVLAEVLATILSGGTSLPATGPALSGTMASAHALRLARLGHSLKAARAVRIAGTVAKPVKAVAKPVVRPVRAVLGDVVPRNIAQRGKAASAAYAASRTLAVDATATSAVNAVGEEQHWAFKTGAGLVSGLAGYHGANFVGNMAAVRMGPGTVARVGPSRAPENLTVALERNAVYAPTVYAWGETIPQTKFVFSRQLGPDRVPDSIDLTSSDMAGQKTVTVKSLRNQGAQKVIAIEKNQEAIDFLWSSNVGRGNALTTTEAGIAANVTGKPNADLLQPRGNLLGDAEEFGEWLAIRELLDVEPESLGRRAVAPLPDPKDVGADEFTVLSRKRDLSLQAQADEVYSELFDRNLAYQVGPTVRTIDEVRASEKELDKLDSAVDNVGDTTVSVGPDGNPIITQERSALDAQVDADRAFETVNGPAFTIVLNTPRTFELDELTSTESVLSAFIGNSRSVLSKAAASFGLAKAHAHTSVDNAFAILDRELGVRGVNHEGGNLYSFWALEDGTKLPVSEVLRRPHDFDLTPTALAAIDALSEIVQQSVRNGETLAMPAAKVSTLTQAVGDKSTHSIPQIFTDVDDAFAAGAVGGTDGMRWQLTGDGLKPIPEIGDTIAGTAGTPYLSGQGVQGAGYGIEMDPQKAIKRFIGMHNDAMVKAFVLKQLARVTDIDTAWRKTLNFDQFGVLDRPNVIDWGNITDTIYDESSGIHIPVVFVKNSVAAGKLTGRGTLKDKQTPALFGDPDNTVTYTYDRQVVNESGEPVMQVVTKDNGDTVTQIKTEEVVVVDSKALDKAFEEKAWRHPNIDGVVPFPEDFFKSSAEYGTYLVGMKKTQMLGVGGGPTTRPLGTRGDAHYRAPDPLIGAGQKIFDLDKAKELEAKIFSEEGVATTVSWRQSGDAPLRAPTVEGTLGEVRVVVYGSFRGADNQTRKELIIDAEGVKRQYARYKRELSGANDKTKITLDIPGSRDGNKTPYFKFEDETSYAAYLIALAKGGEARDPIEAIKELAKMSETWTARYKSYARNSEIESALALEAKLLGRTSADMVDDADIPSRDAANGVTISFDPDVLARVRQHDYDTSKVMEEIRKLSAENVKQPSRPLTDNLSADVRTVELDAAAVKRIQTALFPESKLGPDGTYIDVKGNLRSSLDEINQWGILTAAGLDWGGMVQLAPFTMGAGLRGPKLALQSMVKGVAATFTGYNHSKFLGEPETIKAMEAGVQFWAPGALDEFGVPRGIRKRLRHIPLSSTILTAFEDSFVAGMNNIRRNAYKSEVAVHAKIAEKAGKVLNTSETYSIASAINKLTGVPDSINTPEWERWAFFAAGYFRSQRQLISSVLTDHDNLDSAIMRQYMTNAISTAMTISIAGALLDPDREIEDVIVPINLKSLAAGELRVNSNLGTLRVGNTDLDLLGWLKPLANLTFAGVNTVTGVTAAATGGSANMAREELFAGLSQAIDSKGSPLSRVANDILFKNGRDFDGRVVYNPLSLGSRAAPIWLSAGLNHAVDEGLFGGDLTADEAKAVGLDSMAQMSLDMMGLRATVMTPYEQINSLVIADRALNPTGATIAELPDSSQQLFKDKYPRQFERLDEYRESLSSSGMRTTQQRAFLEAESVKDNMKTALQEMYDDFSSPNGRVAYRGVRDFYQRVMDERTIAARQIGDIRSRAMINFSPTTPAGEVENAFYDAYETASVGLGNQIDYDMLDALQGKIRNDIMKTDMYASRNAEKRVLLSILDDRAASNTGVAYIDDMVNAQRFIAASGYYEPLDDQTEIFAERLAPIIGRGYSPTKYSSLVRAIGKLDMVVRKAEEAGYRPANTETRNLRRLKQIKARIDSRVSKLRRYQRHKSDGLDRALTLVGK